MTAPIDYQSPPSRRRRFRIPVALLVVPVLLLAGVVLLGLLIWSAFSGTSESVSPADATQEVAISLMQWGVFGTVPDHDPDYMNLKNSVASRMTGIHGFTESDGGHGDGTDWYEVELSPDLAAQLRSALAQSTSVKMSRRVPHENAAPPWWPKTWPADALCYEKGLQYFVLPSSGTRAWFLRIRT